MNRHSPTQNRFYRFFSLIFSTQISLSVSALMVLTLLVPIASGSESAPGQSGPTAIAHSQFTRPPMWNVLTQAKQIPVASVESAEQSEPKQLDDLRAWNGKGITPTQNGISHNLKSPVLVWINPANASTDAISNAKNMNQNGRILRTTNGSSLWSASVLVKNAYRLRLQLTQVDLPKGAVMWVYDDSGEVVGPFGNELVDGAGNLWTPSVAGPVLNLVALIPGESTFAQFTLSTIAELFRLDSNGQPVLDASKPQDTSCLVEAQCTSTSTFSHINDVERAVAHIQFMVGGAGFICTGGLLNDTVSGGFIPYFLTANHCLSTQASATSLEAYWDFKPPTCGGAAPSLGSVPRTSGSTLLATGTAGDYTLLQLSSEPGNRYFMGWNCAASARATGTILHRVSHPQGNVQHYSQNQILAASAAFSCSGLPQSQFIYSLPTIGGTQGGSSGAPVMTDNGQVVGQLFGACGDDLDNACSTTDNTVDGSLNSYCNVVTPWLNPSTQGPDVRIGPGDVSFNPPGPVPPGTQVQITAVGTNTGATSTTCDVFIGLFNGVDFTTIGNINGVSFPAGSAQRTQFGVPWNTTGLQATSQPVLVNIHSCSPADTNESNNEVQIDYELPVELASFVTTSVEGGVRLDWTTESEVANLGFNIFRAASPEGPFTPINTKLTKGAGTTPYRQEYTFVDNSTAGQQYYYYLEDMSLGGATSKSWVSTVNSAAGPTGPTQSERVVAIPIDREIESAPAKRAPSGASFSSFKVLVDESAIIQIAYSDLQRSGIDPGLINLSKLSIRNKGELKSVQVLDGGDGSFDPGDNLRFDGSFNQGTQTYEDVLSRVNVYWFSWVDGTPSPTVEGFTTDTGDGPYLAALHFEKDFTYSRLGDETDANSDHWFWEQIDSPDSKSFHFSLQDVAAGTASLRVMLHGNTHLPTTPDHSAGIYLNGTFLGNVQWDGQKPYQFDTEIPVSYLVEGENTLTVTASDSGIDSFFMNWVELDYSRSTPLPMTVSPAMEILGYESAQLRSPENAADYLVITHGDFMESALRLAEYRESKGMRTKVVDIADVYDEFSEGLVDYTAIRSFLKYAYANWQGAAPSYVVLFGDAYEDPKDNLGLGLSNFIPAHPYVTPAYAYENENETFGLSYSDHWFADLDGDDMTLEVSLGRLPVTNEAEAALVVQKIIDYEASSNVATWKQRALFINGGYNTGEESLLDSTSEHLIASKDLFERADRVYMSPAEQDLLQFAGDKNDVITYFNRGVGLVNYLGHAGAESWDVLFQDSDVSALSNYQRLPFVMSLTCWTGAFTGARESLGELLLKGENGGAIAFLGSTSAGLLAGDSLLDFELFEQLFQGDGIVTLGKVVDGAKAGLLQKHPAYAGFVQTYVLLGDPALELKLGHTLSEE